MRGFMPNSKKNLEWYLISIEGAQLKKRVNIQVYPIEQAQNIGGRKQFHISIKREKLDEGVYLKTKSKLSKKVCFSSTFYRRASIVDDDIDKIMTPLKRDTIYGRSLSKVKDQAPTPHFKCTQV